MVPVKTTNLIDLSPESAVFMNDAEGKPVAFCKFLVDSPGTLFFDMRGFLRCRIEINCDGTPHVELFDAKTGEALSRLLTSKDSGR